MGARLKGPERSTRVILTIEMSWNGTKTCICLSLQLKKKMTYKSFYFSFEATPHYTFGFRLTVLS